MIGKKKLMEYELEAVAKYIQELTCLLVFKTSCLLEWKILWDR